ncbi:hypothetical protein HPB50_015038 [Hyalomma asiaticum]|uniref:Uncharacterized protein n=1 Tax=Hyalomma asiaticum TaxID=266040 RepID=A0ACB7SQN7_HYAAI|nr:hypothetical protein HPB50_015038 [Hyalomma asiaticum]
MAAPTEDLPPGFTLSSTTGRSRAYDLLLREAGRILNQPNCVPLSPRRRTRRTKRHTPVRPARRARQANVTTSQPAVPFPSIASSQGPFSLPDPPLQSAEEAAASILCTTLLAQTPSSPPTPGNERDRNARQHVEDSSIPEGDQEQVHASDLSSSSREHTTPPLPAPSSPQASDENSSQLTTAAEPSASASPGPPLTLPKGKEARRCRPSCGSVLSPFLFNLMLAPLIECLPSAAPFPVRAVIYADDIALYVRGPTRQCSRVDITYNVAKPRSPG